MQVGDLVRPKYNLHKGAIGVIQQMREKHAKVFWNSPMDPYIEYWLLEVI